MRNQGYCQQSRGAFTKNHGVQAPIKHFFQLYRILLKEDFEDFVKFFSMN